MEYKYLSFAYIDCVKFPEEQRIIFSVFWLIYSNVIGLMLVIVA